MESKTRSCSELEKGSRKLMQVKQEFEKEEDLKKKIKETSSLLSMSLYVQFIYMILFPLPLFFSWFNWCVPGVWKPNQKIAEYGHISFFSCFLVSKSIGLSGSSFNIPSLPCDGPIRRSSKRLTRFQLLGFTLMRADTPHIAVNLASSIFSTPGNWRRGGSFKEEEEEVKARP